MKKLFLLIVLIVIGIAGYAPYLAGSSVKSSIEQGIALMNQENPFSGYSVEEYSKGWFSSTATLSYDITSIPALASVPEESFPSALKTPILFDISISHGPYSPFGLASFTLVPRDDGLLREYISWSQYQSLMEISGVIDFSGQAEYRFAMPEIVAESDNTSIRFSGVMFEGIFGSKGLTLDGEMGTMEVSNQDGDVSLGPITFDIESELNLSPYELYDAEFTVLIDQMQGDISEMVTMEALEYSGYIEVSDDETKADLGFKVSLGSAESEQFELDQLIFDMEFRNYSAEFHKDYMEIIMSAMESPDTLRTLEDDIQQIVVNMLSACLLYTSPSPRDS